MWMCLYGTLWTPHVQIYFFQRKRPQVVIFRRNTTGLSIRDHRLPFSLRDFNVVTAPFPCLPAVLDSTKIWSAQASTIGDSIAHFMVGHKMCRRTMNKLSSFSKSKLDASSVRKFDIWFSINIPRLINIGHKSVNVLRVPAVYFNH